MSDDRQNATFRQALRQGEESAKIRSHGDAILRAMLVAAALVVAWISPVGWYWKIAIFIASMFVIGVVVQAFALRRERRQQGRRG